MGKRFYLSFKLRAPKLTGPLPKAWSAPAIGDEGSYRPSWQTTVVVAVKDGRFLMKECIAKALRCAHA